MGHSLSSGWTRLARGAVSDDFLSTCMYVPVFVERRFSLRLFYYGSILRMTHTCRSVGMSTKDDFEYR